MVWWDTNLLLKVLFSQNIFCLQLHVHHHSAFWKVSLRTLTKARTELDRNVPRRWGSVAPSTMPDSQQFQIKCLLRKWIGEEHDSWFKNQGHVNTLMIKERNVLTSGVLNISFMLWKLESLALSYLPHDKPYSSWLFPPWYRLIDWLIF